MKANSRQSLNQAGKRALVSLLIGQFDLAGLQALDPSKALPFILKQGLQAHLFWRLTQISPQLASTDPALEVLRSELQASCILSGARNLQMDVRCRQVVSQMVDAGIDVMLLKGTAIRARYDDLAGRPQGDTDIMVRIENLEMAEKFLIQAGYQLDERELTRAQALASHFNLCFRKDGELLELHWAMSIDCPDEVATKAWQRAEKIDWYGIPVLVPGVPDQAVFTLVHICRNVFSGSFRAYGDLLYELERHPKLGGQLWLAGRDWPPRMIRGPIKVLGDIGFPRDSQAEAFCRGYCNIADHFDYWMLSQAAQAALFEEKWLGLPMWRFEKAIFRWLIGKSASLPWSLMGSLKKQVTGKINKAGGKLRKGPP